MSEYQLPQGWMPSAIQNITSADGLISDGDWVESKDQDPSGSIRLIQLADIGDGDFRNKSNRFMSEDKASLLNCTLLEEGDVLVARMPDPLGRACLFPGVGQPAVTVVDVCLIRVGSRSALTNHLLKYWINSPSFRGLISENASGTTRKRITRKKLEKFEVPVPSLAEQKVIADKLDTLLAQVENTKARLERIPQILKRFRQSVLAAAVSGRLTGTGEQNFATIPVEQLAKQKKYSLGIGPFGSNLKVSDYREAGHPLVFVREIRANQFGDDATKYVSGEKFDELKAHRVAPGDILITKMGDPPGDIAIYPLDRPEAVITADCIKLSVDESAYCRDYVAYAMQSEQFRRDVLSISAGVAQQKVNLTKFRKLPLQVPPKAEQTEIVRRVDQLFAHADRIEQQVNNALARVNNLTQSILAKAFRGELTEQWRKDNPELISGENSAEALLERIKAERAAVKPAKRIRRKINA
ncbi:restriction endonuclease subunit S [Marinobacter sp. VGCF2001]|uniref:restriction endonuclease subunit S n=1 Tax=Marinobacter sp. VGCF2001 TaxID=3417189 RepID=UPI003CEB9AAF